MGLKIYGIGASRASRPFWAALELDVPFEHINQSYKNSGTRTPEFLAINPNGHIPVVVDERPEGKVTVWESMACALYIARVHGKADGQSITPANAREERRGCPGCSTGWPSWATGHGCKWVRCEKPCGILPHHARPCPHPRHHP